MKKLCFLLVLMMCLSGCVHNELPVMETVADDVMEPVTAEPKPMAVWLPEGAAAQTVAVAGECYTWGECELRLLTLPGGDIRATLQQLTGLSPDRLTVMEYERDGLQLYQTVWSATGEEGITLQLGDETSLGGECYASIGDGKIYLVDVSLIDNFNYELLNLAAKEEIPYMDSVAEVTLSKGEESVQLDLEEDAELVESLAELYWMDCVSYKAQEEQSAYGLDEPVIAQVTYVETESVDTGETDEEGEAVYETVEHDYTFTVEIGCSEDGKAYGRLPESKQIYEIETAIAEMLAEVW